MKLISLNIEGKSHTARVLSFLGKENADVLCLMEASDDFQDQLHILGYTTTFAPMMLREQNGETFTEGVLLASRLPHHATSFYYHGTGTNLRTLDRANVNASVDRAVIVARIGDLTVCTTHFTWTPRGETPCEYQVSHLEALVSILKAQSPHILCGDFNIPRNLNPLYQELLKYYSDTIPSQYTSSLDPTLHHLGAKPDKQLLFDSFMVDYVFTQPPYTAYDVRLEFGVSDHAAVVASISLT